MWPISCVTVFWRSHATHAVLYAGEMHFGESTVLKMNDGTFSSMSASRMRPDCGSNVVVVSAMAWVWCSQQSNLLPQACSASTSQHTSVGGATSEHFVC